MSEFTVDRLIYDPSIYDAFNDFSHDLPFYSAWSKKANGPVLELCCGTGRLTIPLAQQGIDITGLEFTPMMLERAKEKAIRAGIQIDWFQEDMRQFNLNRKFKMIFIPFNSLQQIYTSEDLELVFERISSHLFEDGYFVFNVFNPSIFILVDRFRTPNHYHIDLSDGRKLEIVETCNYDSATQVNRVIWVYKFDGDPIGTPQRLDMRCFFPLELDALLKYSGWKVLGKFGNFDESAFCSDSPNQIYVCQRR